MEIVRCSFVGVLCVACGGQLAEPSFDAGAKVDAATAPDAEASTVDAAPVTHCVATTATILATGDPGYRVALDDAYVYWVTQDDTAHRVAKAGGPVEELGAVSNHGALVVTDKSLFVGPAKIVRLPKTGGTAEVVEPYAQSFAVDAAETTLAYVAPSPTTIYARALPSGPATAIATLSYVEDVWALAIPGDGYVYYGTETVVARVPVAGGPIEKLAPAYVETFAFDATTLFYSQEDGQGASQILQVPRAGGAATFMAATVFPRDIGVDATRIFWTDDTSFWQQSKTSGWPKAIAPTQQAGGPYVAPSFAIDDTCIYWSPSGAAGAIYAMPIPAP